MTAFSTDADLLTWEPALLREVALDGQTLARGDGASAQGQQLTAPGADLVAARVRPGHVVHLAGTGLDGFYEVLSVESASALLAAPVGCGGDEPVPLPTATGLAWTIATFDPQHEEARWTLLARFGLERNAADPAGDLADWIVERRALRRASVALVLATVYRGQASAPDGGLARKADHYARVYEAEVATARLHLDRDGDGTPDDVRSLASRRLRRV